MSEDIVTLIKTNEKIFTNREAELAHFVLENAERVIYMTITELADELKIGQGTIVRFCQKLGFSGFHPFKIALAKSLGQSSEENHEIESLIDVVRRNHIEAIEETSKLLSVNEKIVRECATRIATCRRLYLLGVGASGVTAMDAFYKFMRIGIDARYNQDPHLLAMWLSECNEQDCVLAFSQSGSTAIVVDMANLAKHNGSCIIAVTAYARSPLAEHANFVLLTSIRESPFQSGAIRSKIAQLHVLEVLFEQTKFLLSDKAIEATKRTAMAVEKWIY
ncbi:MurR/RpiR family transcriptional regulator [Pseudothermotoga sp.]|nr:MurR/RpiR family transcriptional regulator [Pseudothermotoga sp.]MDW8140410.1 MurR/RpiR family transcriptional regulator [Pseudothermotoga sp.]